MPERGLELEFPRRMRSWFHAIIVIHWLGRFHPLRVFPRLLWELKDVDVDVGGDGDDVLWCSMIGIYRA